MSDNFTLRLNCEWTCTIGLVQGFIVIPALTAAAAVMGKCK